MTKIIFKMFRKLCAYCLCAFVPSSNSGVALIMVLGLLTVMVLMAVTFAITMRTERLAAGNAADTVRARELVHVGLARAMNALATNLGPSGLYSPGGKAYPSWNATNSYTNINGTTLARWAITNGIVRGEATNYVPRALWTAATNADLTNPSNHWLPVESLIYTNAGGIRYLSESNLMGRVAYVIINCSGLLDANYAGGGVIRGAGTNPSEIAIGNMPEFTPAGGAADFLGRRDISGVNPPNPDYRYETLEELAVLNANSFNGFPSNFFVYSRALPGSWSNNVIPPLSQVVTQVNLSGGRAELGPRQPQIFSALFNAGFTNDEPSVIFNNLLDYVDLGHKPDFYTTPVEAVPMINEVAIGVNITVAGTGPYNYTIRGGITNECWYPFVKEPDAGAVFKLVSRVTFNTGLGAMSDLSDDSPGQDVTPVVAGSLPLNSRQFGPVTINNVPAIVDPVEIKCTVELRVEHNGEVVDRLNAPSIVLTVWPRGALGNNPSYSTNSECLDPRFNFDPGNASLWRAVGASDSLGRTNDWTLNYLSVNFGGNINAEMYVANRPLRSVAELGYLVYSSNKPWHTIKLYGTNLHRVLDVFGLSTNTSDVLMTNIVYRGLVNPNSRQEDALAAVFADMYIDQYSDDPAAAGSTLTMNMAREVYSRLTNSQAFANGFTNLSDIGHALTNFNPLGVITFDNELKKESLFRNACGLLSVRQNMFTIIIEAQAASGGNIPKNPAKQRAIAIVWRDPYTGEMFVRHLKWLGD